MAGEFQSNPGVAGLHLWCEGRNILNNVWNGSACVAPSPANFSTWVNTDLTDNAEGTYTGNAPTGAIAGGVIQYNVRIRQGSSKAYTDPILETKTILSSSGGGGFTSSDRATLDAAAATIALINPSAVTFSGPVDQSGNVTINQGDDYAVADGRALVWTVAPYSGPDLTSATVALLIALRNCDQPLVDIINAAGTINVTGGNATFTMPLTAAQTTLLTAPADPNDQYTYIFTLVITLVSGRLFTPITGSVNVNPMIG